MQQDGNLVHYDGNGGYYYAWNTYTNVNAYVRLHSDGNLVVHYVGGGGIKASNAFSTC